jgi:hypothetical protein
MAPLQILMAFADPYPLFVECTTMSITNASNAAITVSCETAPALIKIAKFLTFKVDALPAYLHFSSIPSDSAPSHPKTPTAKVSASASVNPASIDSISIFNLYAPLSRLYAKPTTSILDFA